VSKSGSIYVSAIGDIDKKKRMPLITSENGWRMAKSKTEYFEYYMKQFINKSKSLII
jgi:hypothetical protein